MPVVRVKAKYQVTLPDELRKRVGVNIGDLFEVELHKGKITLTPKAVVDRDEYTPAQRRIIDAGITKGMLDFTRGRFHGPFDTAEEAIAHIKRTLRQRAARKTKRSR